MAEGHMRPRESLTVGAKKLDGWFERQGRGAKAAFAERLERTPGLITQWCTGQARPDFVDRLAIEILTGWEIHPPDWLDDEERARLARVTRL